ncbi:MAG: hypothetical protein QOG53_531 [Frankiales bacterium]|jgi:hypothetical protein|nr:hypothetical protein [Frankiales bacterium]
MTDNCISPTPTPADEALNWVAAALRSERILKELRRTEVGLLHED